MDPHRQRQPASREPLWGSTRLLVSVLALVVLLGLVDVMAATRGGGRERQAAPARTSAPAPAPTTSPALPMVRVASSKARPSTLQRRRPAPAGVLQHMLSTFDSSGAAVCDRSYAGVDSGRGETPTVLMGTSQGRDPTRDSTVVEVAEPVQLCLWHFAAGEPIHVSVRSPDGRVTTSVGHPPGDLPCLSDNCYSHVNWAAVPGDPLGDYEITADQGPLRATATVRVVPATMRRLLVVGNGIDQGQYTTFRRGATIQVAAAGYRSWSDVMLSIYYTHERALQLNVPELRFLTWVQLRTDALGGAVYGLRTNAHDRPGCYALDTSPRTQALGPVLEADRLTDRDTAPLFCLT
jgi:hypothetical protein